MDSIFVSPEMISLIGEGSVEQGNDWPEARDAFIFTFSPNSSFRYCARPTQYRARISA